MSIWGVIGSHAEIELKKLDRAWDALTVAAGYPNQQLERWSEQSAALSWVPGATTFNATRTRWINGVLINGNDKSNDEFLASLSTTAINKPGDDVDGLFLALLYDKEAQILRLFSDHSGFRNLYFLEHNGLFYFSTNAVQLAKALNLPLDKSVSLHFLQTGMLPSFSSLFTGIRRLAPSSFVEIKTSAAYGVEVQSTSYLKQEHFRKESNFRTMISHLDEWFRFMSRVLLNENGGKKLVDLTVGADSRLLAAYADAEAEESIDFVTSLGEYQGAHQLLNHLKHVGNHLDLNSLEPDFSQKVQEGWVDSFLVAGAERDIRAALEPRIRIELFFKNYADRLSGVMGELLDDFPWVGEWLRVATGGTPTPESFIKFKLNYYQIPKAYSHGIRENSEILIKDLEQIISWYPEVRGVDSADLMYHVGSTRNRHSGLLSQTDFYPSHQYHTPYAFHGLIKRARKLPWYFRAFHRLRRELLYRANPKLCGFRTSRYHRLYPLRGKWLLGQILELKIDYLIRGYRKLAGKLRMRLTGAYSSQPSNTNGMTVAIDSLVVTVCVGETPTEIDGWFDEQFVRERAQMLIKGTAKAIDRIALTRIATIKRLAGFLSVK